MASERLCVASVTQTGGGKLLLGADWGRRSLPGGLNFLPQISKTGSTITSSKPTGPEWSRGGSAHFHEALRGIRHRTGRTHERWACSGRHSPPCRLSTGASCSADVQCISDHCVDGVCCASLCDGLCERCDRAGLEGQCHAAPAGTDPDGDCAADPQSTCGQNGQCDGSGGRQLYSGLQHGDLSILGPRCLDVQ